MPIRPEHRHHYAGVAWRAIRERILARAANCCEQCGVPNADVFFRAGQYWRDPRTGIWREYRVGPGLADWLVPPQAGFPHLVKIVLTIAHLDHDPSNNADENLRALCQGCHLRHDVEQHQANARATRQARKDAARPLLLKAAAEAEEGTR